MKALSVLLTLSLVSISAWSCPQIRGGFSAIENTDANIQQTHFYRFFNADEYNATDKTDVYHIITVLDSPLTSGASYIMITKDMKTKVYRGEVQGSRFVPNSMDVGTASCTDTTLTVVNQVSNTSSPYKEMITFTVDQDTNKVFISKEIIRTIFDQNELFRH